MSNSELEECVPTRSRNKYWAQIEEVDAKQIVKSLLSYWPGQTLEALPYNYLLFITNDLTMFLVSHSLARLCQALSDLLDDIDTEPHPLHTLQGATRSPLTENSEPTATQKDEFERLDVIGILEATPTFELDDTNATTLMAVLVYLESCVDVCNPSVLSRPLVAPLKEVIRSWEWEFLQRFGSLRSALTDSVIIQDPYNDDTQAHEPFGVASTDIKMRESVLQDLEGGTPCSLDRVPPLLRLMRAADFLQIDSLRDLTCAHLASLVMTQTEPEFAQTVGLDRPLSSLELQPIYRRFPFLHPNPAATEGM